MATEYMQHMIFRINAVPAMVMLAFLVCLGSLSLRAHADDPAPQRRILYNNDTMCMFYREPGVTPASIEAFVDRAADSQVDTYIICAACMVSYFPSTTVEWLGDGREPPPDGVLAYTTAANNIENLVSQGHDPLGIAINRAKEQGMEVWLSYRMNDIHDYYLSDSLLFSSFWKDHPEYRVGNGPWNGVALNYAVPEVRQHYYDRIEEVVNRYGSMIDGIELDFQRFVSYFPEDEAEQNIPILNGFVGDIHSLIDQRNQQHGLSLELNAWVLPSVQESRATGLDPVAWANNGYVDSLTASRYLYNDEAFLDPDGYKAAISPNIPVYGAMDWRRKAEQPMTPADYRVETGELQRCGSDGAYLFNYWDFTSPGYIAALDELGNRSLRYHIVDHKDEGDPTYEGWRLNEWGSGVGSSTPIIDGGVDARRLQTDGSAYRYTYLLSPGSVSCMENEGWHGSITLRVGTVGLDPDDWQAHFEVATDDWAYTLLFGTDSEGDIILRSLSDMVTLASEEVLLGDIGPGYHTFYNGLGN